MCHLLLKSLLSVLILALFASITQAQNVVISEIMASNGATLADEDGAFEDWVEILNRDHVPVDMGGWGLTDRLDAPFQWTFPSYVLPAGGRILVWASGKHRPGGAPPEPNLAPGEVPGLVVWLEASTAGAVTGASVATWTDSSGRGNHATQGVASARPTYVAGVVNGQPVVRFNRSNQHHLLLPTTSFSGMEDLANFTALAVARWNGQATSGLFGTSDGSGNDGNVHWEIQSGGGYRLRVGQVNGPSTAGAVGSAAWRLFGATMNSVSDNPSAKRYINGVLAGSTAGEAGDTFLSGYGTLRVGSSYPGREFDGDIAEFVVYNRELSVQEREGVGRYLNTKYALGLNAPAATYPHANFKLAAEGEALVLTRPDGTVADQLPAVMIPRDTSYGRSPDGGEGWAWFLAPTPLTANNSTAFGPPSSPPVFSQERGYVEDPFPLELTHPEPLAVMHYTTDGSKPSALSPVYSSPINVSSTLVVRALAFVPGALPIELVTTHTYLFASDIAHQVGIPAGYPSTWGSFTHVSYGMSPVIAAEPGHGIKLANAFASIPTLALSLPVDDAFGSGGVYANPTMRGLEVETSAEWIHPDGRPDFQIDCGLRVQGGASRDFNNTPKKSLRLLFKGEYGATSVDQAVFSDAGLSLDAFNSIILRADYNNSWLHWDAGQRLRGSLLRDQWLRETQLATGGAGAHGTYVHLFVNGRYWGLYNPAERADAAYAAAHFGGEASEYDAMSHRGLRDGQRDAWDSMFTVARAGLADPANYAAIQQLLDIDHFIEYMIINHFGGNWDWPGNNWTAVRRRTAGEGYLFIIWDAERTLESATDNRVSANASNGPGELYTRLRDNAEFRMRFADRLHRLCFNGGVLTPERNEERLRLLAERVGPALYGEEARWGAYRHEIYDRNGPSPRYRQSPHWLAETNRLVTAYFPVRTDTLITQYRAIGLYPLVDAPVFSRHGGVIPEDEPLSISAAAGVVYTTTGGTDPRMEGGAISPDASTVQWTLPSCGSPHAHQSPCARQRRLERVARSRICPGIGHPRIPAFRLRRLD
jgi:hypothetical protein